MYIYIELRYMTTTLIPVRGASVQNSLAFLTELLKDVHLRDFTVRLWEGTTLPASQGQPTRFTLVIQNPGALRRMFSSPSELSLGEAYIYNDCDIEGDIESAVSLGKDVVKREPTLHERLRLQSLLLRLPNTGPPRERGVFLPQGRLHSKERDRRAVQYHYDVSNDFYALFLDSRMIYSAACFTDPHDDLDTAQLYKLEKICRALRLEAGERLLDIGCGWGGLIIHAAESFGVDAVGITPSERQAELARERIRKAGLKDRCHVEICDYRDLEGTPSFDKIASVGMVEHVGARQLPEYFSRTCRLLRPDGLFLNAGISRPSSEPAHRTDSFIDAYVFPDGELETIHDMLRAAEMAGFEVCSIENLRKDYGLTLRHWVRRLESHAEEARLITDDFTYRVWRLYMAGSAARFMSSELYVFHTLLAKTGDRGR
jgi:cyclopropane-fatty-acyl-phospholipid synthase